MTDQDKDREKLRIADNIARNGNKEGAIQLINSTTTLTLAQKKTYKSEISHYMPQKNLLKSGKSSPQKGIGKKEQGQQIFSM